MNIYLNYDLWSMTVSYVWVWILSCMLLLLFSLYWHFCTEWWKISPPSSLLSRNLRAPFFHSCDVFPFHNTSSVSCLLFFNAVTHLNTYNSIHYHIIISQHETITFVMYIPGFIVNDSPVHIIRFFFFFFVFVIFNENDFFPSNHFTLYWRHLGHDWIM